MQIAQLKVTTPRLILSPVTLADLDDQHAIETGTQPQLAPCWSWATPNKPKEVIKAHITQAVAEMATKDCKTAYYTIRKSEDNQLLGLVWFFVISPFAPVYELAYFLDSNQTGSGYMTEAL